MSEPSMRQRVRRSPQAWRKLVAEHAASGLSQKAFCAQRGLALSSFCNARRRMSQRPPLTPAACADFMAVELDGGSHEQRAAANDGNGWEVELSLFDGLVLRMRRS